MTKQERTKKESKTRGRMLKIGYRSERDKNGAAGKHKGLNEHMDTEYVP